VKTPFQFRHEAAFDLDGPPFTTRQVQHQIHFGAGGSAIEACNRPLGSGAQQDKGRDPLAGRAVGRCFEVEIDARPAGGDRHG
jgi:hypothetical protein